MRIKFKNACEKAFRDMFIVIKTAQIAAMVIV